VEAVAHLLAPLIAGLVLDLFSLALGGPELLTGALELSACFASLWTALAVPLDLRAQLLPFLHLLLLEVSNAVAKLVTLLGLETSLLVGLKTIALLLQNWFLGCPG